MPTAPICSSSTNRFLAPAKATGWSWFVAPIAALLFALPSTAEVVAPVPLDAGAPKTSFFAATTADSVRGFSKTVDGNGVSFVGSALVPPFQITHKFLGDKPEHKLVGPVSTSKGVYYAVAGDLLRVDPQAQAVVERTFVGPTILGLKATDAGGLKMRLDLEQIAEGAPRTKWFPAFGPNGNTVFVPGNGLWGAALLNSFRILRDLPDGTGDKIFAELPKTAAGLNALDTALAAVTQRDHTNLHAHAFRALVAKADDRPEAIDGHLAAAAKAQGATWTDLYRLCTYARILERPAAATTACSRAAADLKQRGIRADAVSSAVVLAVAMRTASRAVEGAVASADVVLADALLEDMYVALPGVEGAYQAYAVFSHWLQARSQSKRASIWAKRSAENRKNNFSIHESSKAFDRFALWWMAVHVGLLAAALVIGLRSGRRQRRRDVEGAASNGTSRGSGAGASNALASVAKPTWIEALLVVAMLGALGMGILSVGKGMEAVRAFATAPNAAIADVLDSPDMSSWAKTQKPTPEIKRLQAYADDALAQALKGKRPTMDKPPATAPHAAFQSLVDAVGAEEIMKLMEGDLEFRATVVIALLCLVLLVGGHALGRRFELRSRLAQYVVVGAAPRLAAISPLVLVVFAGALVSRFTSAGTMVSSMASFNYSRLFGLEAISNGPFPADSIAGQSGLPVVQSGTGWDTWVIVAVVVVHFAFVFYDAKLLIADRKANKGA